MMSLLQGAIRKTARGGLCGMGGPIEGGFGGAGGGCEAALEEVAAGGGFPVDHLAGQEDAGECF